MGRQNKSVRARTSTKQRTPSMNGSNQTSILDPSERKNIVLWRHPITTLHYSALELRDLLIEGIRKMNIYVVFTLILVAASCTLSYYYVLPEWQIEILSGVWKKILWYLWWIGLGILSSVGFGTGLHTFVLYLGPFIVQVTLAAYECNSLDFPSPPYPEDVICPEDSTSSGTTINVWSIMSKVRWEAIFWGLGTAIGELPPYFMARAARLSGQMDEEEKEIEELHEKGHLSVMERAKIIVHDFVQKVGFLGILLCASIPNPLFDLAGITCGHFLIPFPTFFGATLIGKAIIKMHIQQLFVIFIFSEHHVEQVISLIKFIPSVGTKLQAPFKEYLNKQKEKLHQSFGSKHQNITPSWLSWAFEKLVLIMVIYFLLSIVNSLAQTYHKKISGSKKQKQ